MRLLSPKGRPQEAAHPLRAMAGCAVAPRGEAAGPDSQGGCLDDLAKHEPHSGALVRGLKIVPISELRVYATREQSLLLHFLSQYPLEILLGDNASR
jgi:hypothetical protein